MVVDPNGQPEINPNGLPLNKRKETDGKHEIDFSINRSYYEPISTTRRGGGKK